MTNNKKLLLTLGAVALLVIVFALGAVGGKNTAPTSLGAGGPVHYSDEHFIADIYSGQADVKMISAGVVVGPINTGSNTLKVGSSGGTVTNILSGTATYNPPSLADGVVATTTVTVTGAVVGDSCTVGFSTYGTIGGINTNCQISTTSVALVTMDNESTVTQDNATGTLTVFTIH